MAPVPTKINTGATQKVGQEGGGSEDPQAESWETSGSQGKGAEPPRLGEHAERRDGKQEAV